MNDTATKPHADLSQLRDRSLDRRSANSWRPMKYKQPRIPTQSPYRSVTSLDDEAMRNLIYIAGWYGFTCKVKVPHSAIIRRSLKLLAEHLRDLDAGRMQIERLAAKEHTVHKNSGDSMNGAEGAV